MEESQLPACAMCEREKPLTFHHLIPKSTHTKKWCKKRYSRAQLHLGIYVCRACHSKIHQVFDEKTLARYVNTLEKIMADEGIQTFVAWVSKQDKF